MSGTKILSEADFNHVEESGVQLAEAADASQCLLRILSDRSINGRSFYCGEEMDSNRISRSQISDEYRGILSFRRFRGLKSSLHLWNLGCSLNKSLCLSSFGIANVPKRISDASRLHKRADHITSHQLPYFSYLFSYRQLFIIRPHSRV